MELFYIRFKGRITGPFQKEEMRKRAQERLLSRFHDISTDGTVWKKASAFGELFSIPSDVNELLAPEVIPKSFSQPFATQPATDPFAAQPALEAILETPLASESSAEMPVIKSTEPVLEQWHYQQRSGSQCGPLPFSVMQNLIQQGDIARSTLIWSKGLKEWQEAQYVAEFTSLFS